MRFRPKLLDTLKGYNRTQFTKDIISGIIVGIVALPLAIAFAIASGVSPEKGLYTAIIAGFIISALGGSRVQIGGPTGAFIVVIYGIIQQYGYEGLLVATLMAGVMLILMGLARLGSVIKFIPYPLVVGFTAGIAVIIFVSQLKDFLGLKMGEVPADFLEKLQAFALNISSTNIYALIIALVTIATILLMPKISAKIPGSLVAIVLTTFIANLLPAEVETIGSRFGAVPSSLPAISFPHINMELIRKLLQPAFTIAMLGGIESLLSAVVADGMTGGNHRSNTELVAQGTANIFSSFFGGIPATGAIARTATNVKNGGRTPVAGIVHALTLLFILLFAGQWAALIPMATLAGILVVVAYNMSEWRNFVSIVKGPKNDALVLVVTFLLTVLVDLTVAIEIGIILAAFLFMRRMTQISSVKKLAGDIEDEHEGHDAEAIGNYKVPPGVTVYEINGPLFFGAAYKFKDAIRLIDKPPRILVIRMRNVPVIDATGIRTLEEVEKECRQTGTKIILSGIRTQEVTEELKKSRLIFKIGKANILPDISTALERSKKILEES